MWQSTQVRPASIWEVTPNFLWSVSTSAWQVAQSTSAPQAGSQGSAGALKFVSALDLGSFASLESADSDALELVPASFADTLASPAFSGCSATAVPAFASVPAVVCAAAALTVPMVIANTSDVTNTLVD